MVKQFKGPEKFQRGLGAASLCARCNGWTAAQYGQSFATFTKTAMAALDCIPDNTSSVLLPFTCSPLRVGKQLAVMALAVSATFTLNLASFNRLRQLVLNPLASGAVAGVHFWAYLMKEGEPRLTSMGVPFSFGGAMPFVWCEIALPPLGYVVTGDRPHDLRIARRFRLCNVTPFLERPDSSTQTVFLHLPLLRPIGGASLQYEGYDNEFVF